MSLICLGGTRMLYLKRLTETQTCDENSPRLYIYHLIDLSYIARLALEVLFQVPRSGVRLHGDVHLTQTCEAAVS